MHLPAIPPATPTATPDATARKAVLMDKARELEAGFLAEMLSYAGLGSDQGSFSGGAGEEQFASFLRQEQAKVMVAHGGIGLAEHLFRSLERRDHGNS